MSANRPTNTRYLDRRRSTVQASNDFFTARAPEAREFSCAAAGITGQSNWAGKDGGAVQFATADGSALPAFAAVIEGSNFPGRYGEEENGRILEGGRRPSVAGEWATIATVTDGTITQITARFNRVRIRVTTAAPALVAWVL